MIISAKFEGDGHIIPLLMLIFGCSELSEAERTCYRKTTKFSSYLFLSHHTFH